MENNELEEMRAQLATLNGKLDNESIVDERHFSKATKKHLSELQRKLIVRIVIITLWAAYFYWKLELGIFLLWCVGLLVISIYTYLVVRQGNSASMPVTEYARRLRKTLKIYKIGNRFLWILTILLIMAWGVYVFVLSVSYRPSGAFVLLFVMFELMYTIVPTKKLRFKNQVPGALFAAFAWVTVTKIFSLYIDIYASKSYLYGSLTTVIMLMFWMYFVIYFVFIGAQINEYLQTCRDREKEYELSKYHKDATEVWDDDEIEDPELGEFTKEEMEAILDTKEE